MIGILCCKPRSVTEGLFLHQWLLAGIVTSICWHYCACVDVRLQLVWTQPFYWHLFRVAVLRVPAACLPCPAYWVELIDGLLVFFISRWLVAPSDCRSLKLVVCLDVEVWRIGACTPAGGGFGLAYSLVRFFSRHVCRLR